MLYEVITSQITGFRSGDQWYDDEGAPVEDPNYLDVGSGFGHSFFNYAVHIKARITSYNVCYTKLLRDAMEQALENHEFILYYQPKIDITTKTIFGAEALVRWKRPGHGLVPPDRFIPLFEDNGFIVSLDYYVLDSVCATLRSLIDSGHSVYPRNNFV